MPAPRRNVFQSNQDAPAPRRRAPAKRKQSPKAPVTHDDYGILSRGKRALKPWTAYVKAHYDEVRDRPNAERPKALSAMYKRETRQTGGGVRRTTYAW